MSCAGVVPFEYFNFDFICPLITFTLLIEDELNGQTISSGDKIWRKLPVLHTTFRFYSPSLPVATLLRYSTYSILSRRSSAES